MIVIIRRQHECYRPGDRVDLPAEVARLLISDGMAFSVADTKLGHRMENADVCPRYHKG